jgi:hypothetical protein
VVDGNAGFPVNTIGLEANSSVDTTTGVVGVMACEAVVGFAGAVWAKRKYKEEAAEHSSNPNCTSASDAVTDADLEFSDAIAALSVLVVLMTEDVVAWTEEALVLMSTRTKLLPSGTPEATSPQ